MVIFNNTVTVLSKRIIIPPLFKMGDADHSIETNVGDMSQTT